jgi:hypothetical protein
MSMVCGGFTRWARWREEVWRLRDVPRRSRTLMLVLMLELMLELTDN